MASSGMPAETTTARKSAVTASACMTAAALRKNRQRCHQPASRKNN
jgi:hypothetical protein